MNVLTEYDQSTLPLMQHQPMSVIRQRMEETVRLQMQKSGGGGGEETRDARLAMAAQGDGQSATSKSAFF